MNFLVEHDDPIRKLDAIASLRRANKECKHWVDAGLMRGMKMKPIVELDMSSDDVSMPVLDLSLHASHLKTLSVTQDPRQSPSTKNKIEVIQGAHCTSLRQLTLQGLSSLRKVQITGCEQHISLDISDCTLQEFNVSGTRNGLLCLERVACLATLDVGNFRGVQVYECDDVEYLGPCLSQGVSPTLNALRGAYMFRLPKLKAVHMRTYINLSFLDIDSCHSLETLDISHLRYLGVVIIKRCSNLQFLDVSGCVGLSRLVIQDSKDLSLIRIRECSSSTISMVGRLARSLSHVLVVEG